jgi:hypothetical protein
MIKYLLGAILALAIIGGAFEFKSNEHSWQLIIHKKETLNSVTNGALRIYKIVLELFSDSEFSNSTEIINEDS